MSEQLDALKDEVIENLDPKYELVYVDYRDRLTDDQVRALVRSDWDDLWESLSDWESESRETAAAEIAYEVTKAVIRGWEARDERDYDDLWDEFRFTPQYDAVMEAIKDRDDGEWLHQLCRQTPAVLMRSLIVDEDHGWSFQPLTPSEVIKAYVECAEPGTVLKRNKHNLDLVRGILNESSPEHSVLLGMIVYAVDVEAIYLLSYDTEYVDVINPHLYLGNPFAGSGWCDGPCKGTFRIKREDLRTDRDAFGYGWDEVAGVVTSYYEAEIRAVPGEKKETA
jgi:hypothetical protein